jgi:phosphoglycerol transferase
MVFQLPYVPFPENPNVNKMSDYDLYRGYLHSKSLRWSYGAMKGRDSDAWQRSVASRPLGEFVGEISKAGFKGIYIDRFGYEDNGANIESELSHILKSKPIVSENGRLAFYELSS